MNPGWKFHLGDIELHNFAAIHESRFRAPEWMKAGNHGIAKPAYPDDHWSDVDLPHDFVVEQPFSPEANEVHGSLPVDVGWYRKVFELEAEDLGKRITLEFDGIYRDSEIWLNGHLVGRHLSGYTSFQYDVTELCNFGGLNALAIRVDARNFELWSYEGGGIYRDVRLLKLDPIHVDYCGTFVRATVERVENPTVSTIEIETTILNELRSPAEVQIVSTIKDQEGIERGQAKDLADVGSLSKLTVFQSIDLKAPQLWSPENPYLYLVETSVFCDGLLVDSYETSFGVRSIHFDPARGVFLNGRPIKLKGVCNHQDHAGVGIAIPDRLQAWRLDRMKEMGCNAMRTAHNPPTPALLELCDRKGILVMDEIRMPGTTPELMGQMESLIYRDRNHPSVILWSLGNEEMLIQETAVGARILQRMQDRAHQLDPTRLCTYSANCDFNEIADNFEANGFRIDVFGANYTSRRNEDGNLDCEGERYDEFHAKYPDWPLIGGETGGSASTRGLYGQEYYKGKPHRPDTADLGIDNYVDLNPEREGDATAFSETMTPWGRSIEDTWRDCAERDFLGGTFLWTGFDYRGETYPFGWPAVVTRYGLMDLCGFPKDAFFYHKAWWTDEPMVHLFPHWNWPGEEGKMKDVWCYSNCHSVELWLNGESLGRKNMPINGKLVWDVVYARGKLEARGYDASGSEIQSKLLETTGDPAAVRLMPESEKMIADGRDMAIIRCEIVDSEGRVVPTAENVVKFEVPEGLKFAGVGNGNPISHEPEKLPERRAYCGLSQLLIQSTYTPGEFVIFAESKGLEPYRLQLASTVPDNRLSEIGQVVERISDTGKHVSSIDGAL